MTTQYNTTNNECSMPVPAECDRDADLVLGEAAQHQKASNIAPPRLLTTEDVIAQGGVVHEDGNVVFVSIRSLNKAIAATQITYWISAELKPMGEAPVLVISAGKVLRAMWVPRFTREDNGATDDFGEYNEANDTTYWPEGWYEWNHCEEVHWALEGASAPSHWAPLPLVPQGLITPSEAAS